MLYSPRQFRASGHDNITCWHIVCSGPVCRKQPVVRPGLRLLKEIFVQAPEFDRSARSNPYAMLDHQIGQAETVEKDDALRKVVHEISRLRAESRSRDKNAL